MIRRMLTDLYATNLAYTHRLVEGLSDEASVAMPAAGINHPRWVIGHLAGTADHMVAVNLFGFDAVLPDNWRDTFGPASKPAADPAAYPALGDLLKRLDELHTTITDAVHGFTPDYFERAIPATLPEGFRKRFPTVGHALLHTMINHESMHLGQLSAWRRVQGLPSV